MKELQRFLRKRECIYYKKKTTLFNRRNPHIMHESILQNTFLNTSYLLLPGNLLSNAITAITILVIHKHETSHGTCLNTEDSNVINYEHKTRQFT